MPFHAPKMQAGAKEGNCRVGTSPREGMRRETAYLASVKSASQEPSRMEINAETSIFACAINNGAIAVDSSARVFYLYKERSCYLGIVINDFFYVDTCNHIFAR